MKKDFEYEYLSDFNLDDVDVSRGRSGKYTILLDEFAKTENKTLKITLKNIEDKNSCTSSIRAYIKKNKLDWTMYLERKTFNVYVVRA